MGKRVNCFFLIYGTIVGFRISSSTIVIVIDSIEIGMYADMFTSISVWRIPRNTVEIFDFCRLFYSWHIPSSFARYICCKTTNKVEIEE